ncbi:MAG: glycosyltransferase, partial [Desulfomonile tiedjei]|nr:glycosyltransferase [Desulfomonile tiedjei]
TYFPDDGCKLHVLVYNIDEKIHSDLQKVRQNVFELVAYLRASGISHVLAHPLFSVNHKLTIENFEKCLLIFKNLELNGARTEDQNRCLQLLLSVLTPEVIDQLAEKYGLQASFPFPWLKNLTGGSDDHSSLTIARRYTEIEDVTGIQGFLKGIEQNKAKIIGPASTPKTLAHNVYSIAYQFYQNKFDLKRYVNGDVIFSFLDRFLQVDQDSEPGILARLNFFFNNGKRYKAVDLGNESVMNLLRQETHRLMWADPELAEIFKHGHGGQEDLDEQWFRFVNKVSNKVLGQFSDHIMDSLAGAHFLNLFHALGSAGALYSLLAPYFVSFSIYSEDRRFSSTVLDRFLQRKPRKDKPSNHIKTAHFTDTFYEINGVAGTLKRQLKAARRSGNSYTVITCSPEDHGGYEGVKNFNPIGVYELSVYPEQKLFYPPFLEMLDFCYNEAFTHIHSATPGPLGLAALAVARILKLPLVGTYHTALPQYAQYLTDDAAVADITWKYVIWYYDQMDHVYVPSRSTATELVEKGIAPQKIRVFPRGVDTVRFHPAKRNGCLDERCCTKDVLKLLYVGRVSREKNLQILANVFRSLTEFNYDVALIVVGDGPYRNEMEQLLSGTRSFFLGYVEGETLASIYASCDIFVFPSTTDTFGNVVLEAQASGLPVIVTDCGGPQENIIPGKTGVVVEGNDEKSLLDGIRNALSDSGRLREMGVAARLYAERRAFDKAFNQAWELYGEVSCRSNGDSRGNWIVAPETLAASAYKFGCSPF